MGLGSKLNCTQSKSNVVNASSRVSVVKSKNALCVIDNGNVRMRFTDVTSMDLKGLKSPLYSLLVP
ncbi:hypothetical protein [Mucilaginibacter sp. RCC_168]|uniref:hypothetical protein n=1 Tax=Mucilaginibacter sp. RCC_168 TaxID=3239221 RepID=UPI003523BB64